MAMMKRAYEDPDANMASTQMVLIRRTYHPILMEHAQRVLVHEAHGEYNESRAYHVKHGYLCSHWLGVEMHKEELALRAAFDRVRKKAQKAVRKLADKEARERASTGRGLWTTAS